MVKLSPKEQTKNDDNKIGNDFPQASLTQSPIMSNSERKNRTLSTDDC
jgi:hypothetical protein